MSLYLGTTLIAGGTIAPGGGGGIPNEMRFIRPLNYGAPLTIEHTGTNADFTITSPNNIINDFAAIGIPATGTQVKLTVYRNEAFYVATGELTLGNGVTGTVAIGANTFPDIQIATLISYWSVELITPSITLSNLGLAEGDRFSYFIVQGGHSGRNQSNSGRQEARSGGRILTGIHTIIGGETEITFTPGLGGVSPMDLANSNRSEDGQDSTIEFNSGVTLSSQFGNDSAGWGGAYEGAGGSASTWVAPGPGINGFGRGGFCASAFAFTSDGKEPSANTGSSGRTTTTGTPGADGIIIINY